MLESENLRRLSEQVRNVLVGRGDRSKKEIDQIMQEFDDRVSTCSAVVSIAGGVGELVDAKSGVDVDIVDFDNIKEGDLP